MKNTNGKRKGLKGFFLAFLIVALAFLAVGLGTLGSVYGTGDAYELHAKLESDEGTLGVIFRLSDLVETNASGGSTTTRLRLTSVYVSIATIYGEEGTPVTLRVERSTSGTTFSTGLNAVFENFYTPEDEVDENGKVVNKAKTPDATDVFFRFVAPFDFPEQGWRVSTYPYIRLLVNAGPNVLINEIVFVGEKLTSNYEGTGNFCVIPVEVYEATPYADESAAAARLRAHALIDAQTMPVTAQSTYHTFSKQEVYSLMTIAEMRLGNEYAADKNGNPIDTYHVDNVYGALGEDILALGTLMFGMSPFGLRFFPMLAAFGVLVVLSRLIVRLTKSEKAGFVFALIYALSCLTLGYGHLGTPLMLGVFFFACALSLVYRFYANGIKKANFTAVLPLLFGGLFGAAALCVNGAFVIPMLGVVALFIAGMVRQQKAKQFRLEKIAAEAELAPKDTDAEDGAEEIETPEHRAGKVVAEYRFKNAAAPALFFSGLILGTFLLALVGMLPAYFTYLKAFDNPAAPTLNVFAAAWRAFANGFVGTNAYGGAANWLFETLFRGSGYLYAVTAIVVNPIALVAGLFGLCFAIGRLIALLKTKEHDKAWRAELRRITILLAGLVLSAVAALAVGYGSAFILLTYLFSFLLAANFFGATQEGGAKTAVQVVSVIGLVLLALCFAALVVFVFSIPLPSTFITAILG